MNPRPSMARPQLDLFRANKTKGRNHSTTHTIHVKHVKQTDTHTQKKNRPQVELKGYEEALTSYRSAREILKSHGRLKGFSAACLLANMATLEADYKPALEGLERFEEAKKLFVEASSIETEEGGDLLVNLAAQHLKAGAVDMALKDLQRAKEIFQQEDLLNSVAGAKLWMNLGSALMRKESTLPLPARFEDFDGSSKGFKSSAG